MLVGTVDVNERRYCCGVWTSFEHLDESLGAWATIREVPKDEKHPMVMDENAVRGWIVDMDMTAYFESEAADRSQWYGECDSFNVYEYTDKAVGFMGYDED